MIEIERSAKPPLRENLPIVAIGASAGGLEATSRLFDALPAAPGMAFIVVQHLDPTHKSLMVELLGQRTAMTVVEASDGRVLSANYVYVIPPGCYLSVRTGVIHVTVPDTLHGARLPFDRLLKSLARACGPQTIAVILSGTGQDGSAALPALRQAGGCVIAQALEEAEYPGMPGSAIATGVVDHVLCLAEMPATFAAFAERLAQAPAQTSEAHQRDEAAQIAEILDHLHARTGHDFRPYKPGTMARRIARRMGLLAIPADDTAAYLDQLRDEPGECALLVSDLLINVTSFFRDPRMFDRLESTVLPEAIANLLPGQTLRIWVAGCSTGEEAYSMAIVCHDAIAATRRDIKLQVFASDLDPDAIATARDGFYPLEIAAHVTADRLKRHFVAEPSGYRVVASLRAQVVFSVQDVLTDPPFSRINLISCRNLLIYLNLQAQAKVLALFHFALREGGTLVLGTSETVGKSEDRFAPVPGVECCYRAVAHSRPGDAGYAFTMDDKQPRLEPVEGQAAAGRQASFADICHRAVLSRHAPAAVLINRQNECLFSTGPTGRYLRVAPGYATLDLLAMASPGLRSRLRRAIARAIAGEQHVDGGTVRAGLDGAQFRFRIEVESLVEAGEELMLVCFIEAPIAGSDGAGSHTTADTARIAELEAELLETQAEFQAALQQREITNQEHKAINEEALSVNEEFQSANEELLTSKEELQSLNEELTALNGQLQETLDRQRLASDDLRNVLTSTNIGTMFLDTGLHIRFFTPAIKPLFNVIASDLGRPLADLRPVADDPALLVDARKVLGEGAPIEREVMVPGATPADTVWFMRRIFPYRTHDSRIDGVVITFADITDRKLIIGSLETAKHEADRANVAKSRFLAAASHDLRQPLQVLSLLKEQLEQIVTGDAANALFTRFDKTLRALSGMLDALLNINQIEVGAINPQRTQFPIDQTLDRLREEFAPLAQAHDLVLVMPHCAAVVDSDPMLLKQILRNLVGNAIKCTRHGRVMVACRRRGDSLCIEVRDSGIGIEASQLQAIFDEFHQVDNPARDRSRGLGLGLAIVRRLCGLLGHTIDVRSAPDKGSVFMVTVPCCVTPALPPVPDHLPSDPPARTKPDGAAIMVVEDDPDLRDLLSQLLKFAGHSVTSAPDSDAAVALIAQSAIRPDILLTDYNLPSGQTGVDLLIRLRTMLAQNLPAIILTGDISTEAVARIAGVDAARGPCVHMSKPVESKVLMAAIAQLRAGAAPAPSEPVPAAMRVIYVIDDEPDVRLSLCELLVSHGCKVEDFASAETFLAAYRPGTAGCLLVDARLPGLSGIGLLATLRARGDNVPVIMITGDGDVGLAVDAMRAGACEFIEKPVASAELLSSIGRASAQSHGIRLDDEAQADTAQRVAALTARQKQVMTMVLAGHPSKNIAADLGISQRTVENHRAEIMHRMGARSIPELARKVLIVKS